MVFRKNISGGVADQPLQGVTHLIWAMGQTGGFYGEDQFKWHGENRGKVVIGNISSLYRNNNLSIFSDFSPSYSTVTSSCSFASSSNFIYCCFTVAIILIK